MCGIFAYLNYCTEKKRSDIINTLLNGLARLEYRGYDSAGLLVNGNEEGEFRIMKQVGKVAALRKLINESDLATNDKTFDCHIGMAHTRWATHGQPTPTNAHPHKSDPKAQFCVVHNGIITNYKDLKTLLEKKGYMFESQTDTECIAKLALYLFDIHIQQPG